MQTNEYAITVKSLNKSFQDVTVLNDVNFKVKKGSIFSLLGSNGAGKTTTIKILTTLIKPDTGDIKVGGFDIYKDVDQIHKVISLTGQFAAVDESLTGFENLMFIGQLNHLANPKAVSNNLLKYFDLSKSANRLASTYSGGMRRKLDIAMSLVANPKIIFLDEPTTGLDPQSRHNMWKIIKDLNKSGVTIFLTTQYLEEAEQLADIIAILNNGSIIAEGTATDLKKSIPHGRLEFTFLNKDYLNKASSLVTEFKTNLINEEKKLIIYTDGRATTLAQIFHKFTSNAIEIDNFSQLLPTLEDVFLNIIGITEDTTNEKQSTKLS